MPFTFTPCPIEGLYEIQPAVFGDSRGYFLESYSERDFAAAGIAARFVQDNQSSSSRGVLRGLHFQKRHPQAKLVRALSGDVYDVAVDLRNGSPTFGRWHGVVLSAERHNQLYIPEGFAHGFLVLSDTAVFAYKCTDFYHPGDEGGLMWNDPEIAIDWAAAVRAHPAGAAAGGVPEFQLSEKDTRHPAFNPAGRYFDLGGRWAGE